MLLVFSTLYGTAYFFSVSASAGVNKGVNKKSSVSGHSFVIAGGCQNYGSLYWLPSGDATLLCFMVSEQKNPTFGEIGVNS